MQHTEILEWLRRNKWDYLFDAAVVSLAKGQGRRWQPGSMLRWSPSTNGGLLTGSMNDAGRYASHKPSVAVRRLGRDGKLSISATCTCKANGCEHAYLLIAAFLKTNQTHSDFDTRELSSWLANVEASRKKAEPAPSAQLAVVLGTGGPRKNAAGDDLVATPVALYPDGSLQSVDASLLSDEDRARLGVMSITGYEPFSKHEPGMFFVKFAVQESVLLKLMSCGLAFASKVSTRPLTRGPDVDPAYEWQVGPQGEQRLGIYAVDGTAMPLVGIGYGGWYIDPSRHLAGRIRGSGAELRAMRHAPTIQKEHSAALFALWEKVGAAARIVRPSDLNRIVAREGTAIPVLTTSMRQLREPDGSRLRVAVGRLAYDYDGVLLTDEDFDASGHATRVLDGVVTHVKRDVSTHSRVRTALIDAGLVPSHESFTPGQLTGSPGLTASDYVYANSPHNVSAFLNSLSVAKQAAIRVEDNTGSEPQRLPATAISGKLVPREGGDWFELELGVTVDRQTHDLEPAFHELLIDPLFAEHGASSDRWALTLPSGQLVSLPAPIIRDILGSVRDWLDRGEQPTPRRMTALQAAAMAEELGKVVDGRTLKKLRMAVRRLHAINSEPLPIVPVDLKATLRPYQLEGLRWLNALAELSMTAQSGIGGVLADDMGLGKTLQTIAHILTLRDKGWLFAPVLIVVPKSLVGNWDDELEKFAPSLKRMVFQGKAGDRSGQFLAMAGEEVVITTYSYLLRDLEGLREQPFALVVTDESQRVKNARNKAAVALRSLQAFRFVNLSGTPLENDLSELYAHVDLAVPGLLGTGKEFTKRYRSPIEKHRDQERLQQLRRKIAPFLLRRTKDLVASDLPAKTVMVQHVVMEGAQATLYEAVRATVKVQVREAIAKRGIKQAGIHVLDALLKLRQVCCDPRLVKLPGAVEVKESAKLDELMNLIEMGVAEGRRILVYSQFTQMLDLIAAEVQRRDISFLSLTGETKDRRAVVEKFQKGKTPLFLLSLKAGGVGLNLTAADWVIHYDPWWNGAAEAQAADRAHRIGQEKPVFVFRLITKGTVEEHIGRLQARKASLAAAVLDGTDAEAATSLSFTEADISALFGD